MKKNKCWNRVEDALKNRNRRIYYAGGTLVIDWNEDSGIALNLDGTGFVFGHIDDSKHSTKVIQPDYILKMVQETYLETKGETEHFKSRQSPLSWRYNGNTF